MNEIKVFLVEDEMVIRRGIKNSIDWEKEGYIFCGEASDGELAYPMIIKEKPDILITDIRMPFMDGLELCKLVKKELPNIKILILSGYDEFDYAKEAIRLGVTEYLLKPISSGKLLEALNGVSESIRREKEDKDLVRKYMEEMRENTEHEKQKFFEQMIAGNLSMADALETGKKYEMNLSAGMYNLLLFRFTLGEENRKSGELLGEAEYAIEKLTERLEYVFEFQRGVEGWAFLLMADNEEQMSERVKELSKDLEEIMKNYSTIAYFGGIGQPVARLRELEESFREAERALAARFTMELNRIISVEDIRMAQNVDTLDDIEITSFGEIEKTRTMLEKFLNNGAEDEIDEFVDVYINELPEENLKSVLMRQYIIMDAYIVMMSFCEKIEGIEGEMQAQSEELKATSAYAQITKSVSYANMYARDFKERMDYSMYLAVIGKRDMEELGDGETTVNGILTVNPYKYIDELEETCDKLSYMATVDSNRNQIKRLKNSLKSLKGCVKELETAIDSGGAYEDKMNYLNENIYMLTSLIQKGIQDYIYVETTNYTNVKAELDARNTRTFVICIWISVAAIVLALFLTMKAAKSVTKPIQKLCRMTQQVAEGDFTVQTKESNTDEIAVLTRSFNDMTQEIGGLVEDIKQQQKNLRIAETKLLQAQINPHFLYNTLDAIVWLAEENRKDEVVSMVTALSDFFRTTLSKGRDFITVREERSHIESYLKIQQFRYQDIMSYEIDMEENMGEFMIPKLTLQPLVENALYHGLKNKRGGGMIKITGRLDGENMIFTVTDDGKGMTKEVLEKLQESIGKEKGDKSIDGFGIGNVNRRIRYYYGERYGVTLESVENDGTKATVTMAAQKNQPFS